MKPKILLCLALVLSGGVFDYCLTSCADTNTPPVSTNSAQRIVTATVLGSATNGLQMSLSVVVNGHRDNPEFEVAFRNVGERDVCLNLGFMLDNGGVQLPNKIQLNLLDASGRNRELLFSDRRYPGVAGRLDDYLVPLRAGSTYTLKFRLDQFWSPSTKEFVLKLTPGRYEISVQFQEERPETRNLIRLWEGQIQSNTVEIVE